MTTYEELDDIKFVEDLEAMMIKQRWEERSKEERDGQEWTEIWEMKKSEASDVKDGNNLDFAKRKATENQPT